MHSPQSSQQSTMPPKTYSQSTMPLEYHISHIRMDCMIYIVLIQQIINNKQELEPQPG